MAVIDDEHAGSADLTTEEINKKINEIEAKIGELTLDDVDSPMMLTLEETKKELYRLRGSPGKVQAQAPSDNETVARLTEALGASEFDRARRLLDSPELTEDQRRDWESRLDGARRNWEVRRRDDIELAIGRRDFDGARTVVKDISERLGIGDQLGPVEYRVLHAEASHRIGQIRSLLQLDKDERQRALTMPPDAQQHVDWLKKHRSEASLQGLSGAIDVVVAAFEAEGERRDAAFKKPRTLQETLELGDAKRQAIKDRQAGLSTYPVWKPHLRSGRQLLGEHSETLEKFIENADPFPEIEINLAIKLFSALAMKRANEGIESRRAGIEAVLTSKLLLLGDARKELEAARKLAPDADEAHQRIVDDLDRAFAALEEARSARATRLQSLDVAVGIDNALAVVREIHGSDRLQPELHETIVRLADAFLTQSEEELGRANRLRPEVRVGTLESMVARTTVIDQMLDLAPETSSGRIAELRAANNHVRTVGARDRDHATAEAALRVQWGEAKRGLARWLAARDRDPLAASKLLDDLAGDVSTEADALRDKVVPELGVEAKVADAVRRAGVGNIVGAELVIGELRGQGVAEAVVARASVAVERAKEFARAKDAYGERTVAALQRAEEILAHLEGTSSIGDVIDPAAVTDLRSKVAELITDAARARGSLRLAEQAFQARRYDEARSECNAVQSHIPEILAERRSLVDRIIADWRGQSDDELRDAARSGDAELVADLVERYVITFSGVAPARDVARECFEALAQTWSNATAHVSRVERAVAAASVVASGAEDRERLSVGAIAVAERRDLPAIRAALNLREHARALQLLAALDPVFEARERIQSDWVDALVLAKDFDGARRWASRPTDLQARARLAQLVSDAEALYGTVEEARKHISDGIADLERSNDPERIKRACDRTKDGLGDPRVAAALDELSQRWREALRAFEARVKTAIEQLRPDETDDARLAHYELLEVVVPLDASQVVAANELRERLIRRVQREIVKCTQLARSLDLDVDAIQDAAAEAVALVKMPIFRSKWAADDLRRLRRHLNEVEVLQSDRQKLEVAHVELGTLLAGQLRRQADVIALENVLTTVPQRFKGAPVARLYDEMWSEVQTIRREWDHDSAHVDGITKAWDAKDYHRCESLAAAAANEVRVGRDRFLRKARLEVQDGGDVLVGVDVIRTRCTGFVASLHTIDRVRASVEEAFATASAALKQLEEAFASDRRFTDYRHVRTLAEKVRKECEQVHHLSLTLPSGTGLPDSAIAPALAVVASRDKDALEAKERASAVVATLDDDEQRARRAEELVQQTREAMERSRAAPAWKFWDHSLDPVAVLAYEDARDQLRRLRPHG